MEIITAASTLHQQLVSLQNSDNTVAQLERQITSLEEQSLLSTVEDNQSKHLQVVLRLSITEGVHQMYQQYSTNKWAQIQNTARTIKSTLEADNMDLPNSLLPSTPGGSMGMDKAMGVWSSVFCELSRQE